jgi:Holliday junction DNA helicase RuvA
MISAITGQLLGVDDDRAHLQVGPILYELLVPAFDLSALLANVGDELTFYTLLDLEGDPTRGNLQPRLIGFLRPEDRKFFNLFTTVKGIGPKTALRALTVPIGEIAQAIEEKDTRFLIRLNGIGKRTAELIVAELAGKAKSFATGPARAGGGANIPSRRVPFEEDAITALMVMGERRPDAEHLLDRARAAHPQAKTTDVLLREMLRLRTVTRI